MDFGNLTDLFAGWGDALKMVLPRSPFAQFFEEFRQLPFLGWLNWFIPIRNFRIILTAFCGAVAVYYIYVIVLRWVKAIR